MKHTLFPALSVAALLSCSCGETLLDKYWIENVEYEEKIEAHYARLDSLTSMVEGINETLSTFADCIEKLRAMDVITAVQKYVEGGDTTGYVLRFKYSGDVFIRNGKDGDIPAISIEKADDGYYYWYIDGKPVISEEGKMLRSEGIDGTVPIVRINADCWEISYDGGLFWSCLAPAKADEEARTIKNAVIVDGQVIFTLKDSVQFSLPCSLKPVLKVTSFSDTTVLPYKTIEAYFTMENATDNTVVTASADAPYKVSLKRDGINSGIIAIECPKHYEDGVINIIVSNERGYTFYYKINITGRKPIFEEQ